MDREGLLKMYFDCCKKDSYFRVENFNSNLDTTKRVQKLEIDGKKYFLKLNSLTGGKHLNKQDMDSEVFCSYLYHKYGLKGATYVPVLAYGNYGALSDNVADKNVFDGNVLDKFLNPGKFNLFAKEKILLDYCSEQAGKDAVKLSVLDLIVNNSDRRRMNYFVKANVSIKDKNLDEYDLSKEEDWKDVLSIFKNTNENDRSIIVDDLRFIDNGYSVYDIYNTDIVFANFFYSPLFSSNLFGQEKGLLINKLKTDEQVQNFMPIEKTQEYVASIDLKETREKVEDTFKLYMDKKYLNSVTKSYENLQRELDNNSGNFEFEQ